MLGKRFLAALFVLVLSGLAAFSAPASLERGFQQPPDSARPWVYWFWMNGNVSSNGITADLEAMQRVGIGGVLIMSVDQGTPPGPVIFASPQWRGLLTHACAQARRLGLQINLNNDPGWCGSGGPWVTPELSMQKLVWSETTLKGPAHFTGELAQPETIDKFYRDIAVLAFPTLDGDEVQMAEVLPRFTASDGREYQPNNYVEDVARSLITLPHPEPGHPSWLQVEFSQPFTARELTLNLALSPDLYVQGTLEISADGKGFTPVKDFEAGAPALCLDFPAVTSRWFRISFQRRPPEVPELIVTGVELSPRFRIPNMNGRAMFTREHAFPGPNLFPGQARYPAVPAGFTIPAGAPVNLTPQLGPGGRFQWDVPPGSWTVLRFGHTSTGTDNHPAPQGGHGLECDKLRKEGVDLVFNHFVRPMTTELKEFVPQTLVSTHVDSWEVGAQNWTANFRAEFLRRRGYDPVPFLPVITGRVLGNREISERFLWDLRQTISDLLVENYAGELRRLARGTGLRLSIEAYDNVPCDELSYALQADEPMAEFWTWPAFEMAYSEAEMASAAHVTGRPITAAESFTASPAERWLGTPFTAKPFGDWAFCQGINRLVVHRYTLQPWTNPDRVPGMSMGPFGLHYERTQTWWNQSKAWHAYLSRCQFLLQQGRYIADICFLGPQNSPQHWQAPFDSRQRVGYDFDACAAPLAEKELSFKHGRLVLPDGMSYRLLVLPKAETMTPGLLSKVASLVRAGATVLGTRPAKSPSLSGYPACDARVRDLADELWGTDDRSTAGEHRFGKGRVLWGKTPHDVLGEAGVEPDFLPVSAAAKGKLLYIHKSLPSAEVYFVANSTLEVRETVCSFRTAGRQPQLWWPDTGRIERCAVYQSTNGMTLMPLRLEPAGSVFVVFPVASKGDAPRIVAVTKDGQPVLSATPSPQPAGGAATSQNATEDNETNRAMVSTNSTFTMAVWVKPSVDIPLPEEANTGDGLYMMERNDALYPPPGHDVFGGPDHAGAGLSIGRNGLCVTEASAYYFVPVLVYAAPFTNWTHVAIVYKSGRPALYVNGKFVHEGRRSSRIVHSGVGVEQPRASAPFQGCLGEFYGAPRALDASQIKDLMQTMPAPIEPPPLPVVRLVQDDRGTFRAEIAQAGAYVARRSDGRHLRFQVDKLPAPQTITGAWDVDFPPGWGAPAHSTLPELISWSEHAEPGVRYFSGTAVYRKTFTVSPDLRSPNQRVYLDLGKVCVSARVRLNGKDLGVLWKPPFRIDVTEALRRGENSLQIEVANLWVNRMIGDESLPEDSERNPDGTLKGWPAWLQAGRPSPTGRYTFTTWRLWKKSEPLRESGLLGPVQLVATKVVTMAPER